MNITLDYLTGNRKWLVRDFVVWGDTGSLEAAMIATETEESSKRVAFMRENSGGNPQIVEYTDLTDHRGNPLPQTIVNAAIIIVPKGDPSGFVVGNAGPTSFRIAKVPGASPDAQVDLIIMEMR